MLAAWETAQSLLQLAHCDNRCMSDAFTTRSKHPLCSGALLIDPDDAAVRTQDGVLALFDFARTDQPCQLVQQFGGEAVASLAFSPGALAKLGFKRHGV